MQCRVEECPGRPLNFRGGVSSEPGTKKPRLFRGSRRDRTLSGYQEVHNILKFIASGCQRLLLVQEKVRPVRLGCTAFGYLTALLSERIMVLRENNGNQSKTARELGMH